MSRFRCRGDVSWLSIYSWFWNSSSFHLILMIWKLKEFLQFLHFSQTSLPTSYKWERKEKISLEKKDISMIEKRIFCWSLTFAQMIHSDAVAMLILREWNYSLSLNFEENRLNLQQLVGHHVKIYKNCEISLREKTHKTLTEFSILFFFGPEKIILNRINDSKDLSLTWALNRQGWKLVNSLKNLCVFLSDKSEKETRRRNIKIGLKNNSSEKKKKKENRKKLRLNCKSIWQHLLKKFFMFSCPFSQYKIIQHNKSSPWCK
jgi:hypothetical protein